VSGPGVDTNVLLRFLLRDDEGQAEIAERRVGVQSLAGEPVVICLLTLLETEWVLRTRGGLDKSGVITVFEKLLEARDITIEAEDVLEQALHDYRNAPADFADCLINARYRSLGCASMLTFDAKAGRLPGAELLGH
jgi:predicted nucleic-acid-binding protein